MGLGWNSTSTLFFKTFLLYSDTVLFWGLCGTNNMKNVKAIERTQYQRLRAFTVQSADKQVPVKKKELLPPPTHTQKTPNKHFVVIYIVGNYFVATPKSIFSNGKTTIYPSEPFKQLCTLITIIAMCSHRQNQPVPLWKWSLSTSQVRRDVIKMALKWRHGYHDVIHVPATPEADVGMAVQIRRSSSERTFWRLEQVYKTFQIRLSLKGRLELFLNTMELCLAISYHIWALHSEKKNRRRWTFSIPSTKEQISRDFSRVPWKPEVRRNFPS